MGSWWHNRDMARRKSKRKQNVRTLGQNGRKKSAKVVDSVGPIRRSFSQLIVVLGIGSSLVGLAALPQLIEYFFRAPRTEVMRPSFDLKGRVVSGACYSRSLYSGRDDAAACLVNGFWHDPCFDVPDEPMFAACPRALKDQSSRLPSLPFGVDLVDFSLDREAFPEDYQNRLETDGDTRAFDDKGMELPWFLELTNDMFCMRSPTELVTSGRTTQYRCDSSQSLVERVVADSPANGREYTILFDPNGNDGPYQAIGTELARTSEDWFIYLKLEDVSNPKRIKIKRVWL